MARHASQPRLHENAYGYYIILWTENGRSKRVSTKKKCGIEATLFFSDWLRKRHMPSASGIEWNISMLLDSYYAEQVEGGPSAERTRIIVATLKRAFGTALPASLDASAIQRYELERRDGLHGKRKANGSTVRRELTVLIAALNHAVRQRRMRHEDFPHIERPEDGDARNVVIPQDHIELMLANATGRLLSFITIAYETAQRRGAVEGLRWSQFSRDRRLIDFEQSGGSGGKLAGMVPVSERLMSYLISIQPVGVADRYDFILGDDRSIYPAWSSLMARLATETGSDAFLDYVPHDLRRTWATRAAQRGVDLWSIAGVLGDSLAVVTKHYAKHQPEHLRKAMELVG